MNISDALNAVIEPGIYVVKLKEPVTINGEEKTPASLVVITSDKEWCKVTPMDATDLKMMLKALERNKIDLQPFAPLP